MTFPELQLHSERYSVNGNLSAEGFRKLLGTPTLDLLQTVVRESVQNSCDAADEYHVPKVVFRLRTLSQSDALDAVLPAFPGPEASNRAFEHFTTTEKNGCWKFVISVLEGWAALPEQINCPDRENQQISSISCATSGPEETRTKEVDRTATARHLFI